MGITELERPVPLYMQVVRQLRAQIASGALAEPPPAPGTGVTASAAKAAAPAHVAEILGIPSGRRALRRRETRTGEGGQAISTTTTWFPPAVADKAPRLA